MKAELKGVVVRKNDDYCVVQIVNDWGKPMLYEAPFPAEIGRSVRISFETVAEYEEPDNPTEQ